MDTGSFLFLSPAESWLLMMLQDNDFSSQPACYREKNTPTFSSCSVIKHLLVLSSENWSALLGAHRLYITLLLSSVQALRVSNFQRTFSSHENSPRHIIIPIAPLSDLSLLRQCGQPCTHFMQARCQHWHSGINPCTTTLTCCKAVPTAPASLCFAGRILQ